MREGSIARPLTDEPVLIQPPRLTADQALAIRRALGLSQAELAAVLGMSPGNGDRSIRRWEKTGPPIAAGLALLWLQANHEKGA